MSLSKDLDIEIGALELDCGETLPAVRQRVTIDGSDPLPGGENVVFAAHALTGSSRVAEWWPNIVGHDALFDRDRWCIIGINVLGGCYGSTRAPRVTVRDIVRAQIRVFDALDIGRIAFVIGASVGGMQALQLALDDPRRVQRAIVIGAHDHHSAMGIALNAVQRNAISLDPLRGLALARKIAMLTYKSDDLLAERHDRKPDRHGRKAFDVEGYLDHQGSKLIDRMDSATYVTLTHAMDSFDVRDREAPPGVDLTFVGISSDWLFRPQEIRSAARRLNARYLELVSDHGHDAFLAEDAKLQALLAPLSFSLGSHNSIRCHGIATGRRR
jgi:homoserine O-acetyltransferase/O-succinyltransferase